MSKRDPLRPYMDVIDNMLAQMVFLLPISFVLFLDFACSNKVLLVIAFFQIFSLSKTHPLNRKVVGWEKMIWTMTQMRNQWQHSDVIFEELGKSIIVVEGELNAKI